MKKSKALIALLLTVASLSSFSQLKPSYKIIYTADRNGNKLSGNLDSLINYVNNGNPIRVGWEIVSKWANSTTPDSVTVMTHWTDGGFVSTLRGQVFAQIRGIFGQGFAHLDSPPAIFLNSNVPNAWVAVIGTDGIMRSKFHLDEWMSDIPKEELKKMEIRTVKTMWAVMAN